jgi:hypothetical protein
MVKAPLENELPPAGTGNRWKPLLLRLRNKYWIAGIFFLVWMLFFDPKDLGSAVSRWRKYNELKNSELHLEKKITGTKAELGQLKTNARTIEKYAREKYLMKKDNEDLFLVSGPAEQNN